MEIGIVGKPNVGKSTFFKAATLAEVEIKNFPFTTIEANIGVGYVRVPCPCKTLEISCNPQNSVCKEKNRLIPVKLIDVAGLVPGASEGRGLGNKFLDDLRRADVLIHIVDSSGRTDEVGEQTEGHDPTKDITFLEDEIDSWFFSVLKKNWEKIARKIKYNCKNLLHEFSEVLAGLGISEGNVHEALRKENLLGKTEFTDEELKALAISLRKTSKPIIIAANKIDADKTDNLKKLKAVSKNVIPTSSDAELALRQAEEHGVIKYVPGDGSFEIIQDVDEKHKAALVFIKTLIEKHGSTGVQDCLNSAVFDTLDYIVVYPVENENKFMDSKGNVLPDAVLLRQNSTAHDLANKIHTDIGDKFIGAIDCKTKKKIGRDHVLLNGDIIKILTSK